MNSQKLKPKVVVVCGPTGSGKTSAGIELAGIFKGEIVSADSMQIYRHMDIGTAKPSSLERQQIRHHMIDVAAPDEPFSAARYAEMAQTAIGRLHADGILPFVVGGTGLYIKALLKGLFPAEPADPALRSRLKREAENSEAGMHRRLRECDPAAAVRIHPNDTYRILRALEVYALTGKSIVRFQAEHGFRNQPYHVLKIGLDTDRTALYERLDRRVDHMIAAGLLQEVQGLLEKGYAPGLKSMQSIGYRHMIDFAERRLSWSEALRTFKRDTRRYAKRQLTWFRADAEIHWVPADDTQQMTRLVRDFLEAEGREADGHNGIME